MKKLVVLGICMLAASLAFAQPPQKQKKTFSAKVKGGPQPKAPPVVQKETTDGVLPRMSRSGNPFQMLNPKAPAQYGKSEDSVELDADTGKWKGIKLFTINF
ncbi:MAG: hypothetical protein DME57_00490 [Verrucomicrobia bacterium]|nr:MAG: hypothetical protein DME57_00490 [Verrucomicrobiota bacterium]